MKRLYVALMGVFFVLPLINCQNKKIPTGTNSLKSIYYDYDQSFIRNDSAKTLQGNAEYLKSHSSTNATVEGHCDERGSNEYNLALGQRRADSAKTYLMNLGVAVSRMNTVSFGEEKPVCNGHDESCWWKNRRADFRSR